MTGTSDQTRWLAKACTDLVLLHKQDLQGKADEGTWECTASPSHGGQCCSMVQSLYTTETLPNPTPGQLSSKAVCSLPAESMVTAGGLDGSLSLHLQHGAAVHNGPICAGWSVIPCTIN